MLQSISAKEAVILSTEKNDYVLYEPVYLEIQFAPERLSDDFFMSNLRDSRARIGLMFVDPQGNINEYHPLLSEKR